MLTKSRALTVGLLMVFGLCGWRAAAGEPARTLLVVPARSAVIQLAFGVAGMRPVYLVAYDTRMAASGYVLHSWDETKQDWERTSLEAFRSGSLFAEAPARVVLVGSDRDIPAEVAAAAAAIGNVQRVPSLLIKDMVNALNGSLNFTVAEWKWLAKEYGLQLRDLNEGRRRTGRYGSQAAGRQPPPAVETPEVPVTDKWAPEEIRGGPAPAPVEPLPQDR